LSAFRFYCLALFWMIRGEFSKQLILWQYSIALLNIFLTAILIFIPVLHMIVIHCQVCCTFSQVSLKIFISPYSFLFPIFNYVMVDMFIARF
jgi:hypothetical protein